MLNNTFLFIIISILVFFTDQISANNIREKISLNKEWFTIVNDSNKNASKGFESNGYNTENWVKVNIPHTWDTYEGYRRKVHGNRHGYAWYRKSFHINEIKPDKRYFLFFEGVGSYATVWLNGKKVGYHAGGRTTFTLDVTQAIKEENVLAVRSDHPSNINDLPWVCGGCSDEWGFSEGSQPFGIFRPVSLIITGSVKIEPFGIHVWNDTSVNQKLTYININTEIKNYNSDDKNIVLQHKLYHADNDSITFFAEGRVIKAGNTGLIKNDSIKIFQPRLWSLKDPYLYTLESILYVDGVPSDSVVTRFGIRWISWPIYRNDGDHRFYLNGKPVFINGTAEYEHMLGQSHAFSDRQVITRIEQIKAAGFNSFRDAHQPHNLLYQHYWDSLGILFWTQMAAHIWFDNDAFKSNFKQLLRDWVKERRNCPSVILWGLENESTLPTWFAEECTQIIREMDPTSPSQRLVTTCNGGTGTDWNVIQNWSGTYAGNLFAYDKDISRELLNGEYGAWRSIDFHKEGPFNKDGDYTEERMCQLMETKIRLAESAKDSCCGQYQWIFNSHDNPGRTQNGEGYREIDRIGPVNYKGLIAPWGEPADVYYMYRANYASKDTGPMVYIVSHTWPNRWTKPGIYDSITVYSNCDSVELFNGYNSNSLGIMKKKQIGTHFQWNGVEIKYNILTAVGYVNNIAVASDRITLHHLPEAPDINKFCKKDWDLIRPEKNYNYLYRVNCGGSDLVDYNGNVWMADQHQDNDTIWGSRSWTDDFNGLPPFLASQRRTFDPVYGAVEWKLFQTFRYGRDKLKYNFPLPNGDYLIELFFIEPWYGTGGSMNSEGWRVFDVAVNDRVYIDNLDIWKELGHDRVSKHVIKTHVSNGNICISFPEVLSGQAVISAIAIASQNTGINTLQNKTSIIQNLVVVDNLDPDMWSIESWMDIGDKQYTDKNILFNKLPSNFFAAEWIRTPSMVRSENETLVSFNIQKESDVFIALKEPVEDLPVWMKGYIDQKQGLITDEKGYTRYRIYSKRFDDNSEIKLGNPENNDGSMYSVVICPVTKLGYAADQRPQVRYQAEEAVLSGEGLKILEFQNRKYVQFNNTKEKIQFIFKVGLGDTYAIKFRYLNNTEDTIPMKLKIVDMNDIIVRDDIITFSPRKNSWRSLNTTTGTSINAGKYNLILSPVDKTGLGIDALDIQ